jgi:hypothetical protein
VDNQLNMNRQLQELARYCIASHQLLARGKLVATAGLPILLRLAPGIKAQSARPRGGQFDTIDHVTKLAGGKGRVAVEFVEHADHSIANPAGREAVERHLAQWMAPYFLLPHADLHAGSVAASRTAGRKMESRKRQPAASNLDSPVESR